MLSHQQEGVKNTSHVFVPSHLVASHALCGPRQETARAAAPMAAKPAAVAEGPAASAVRHRYMRQTMSRGGGGEDGAGREKQSKTKQYFRFVYKVSFRFVGHGRSDETFGVVVALKRELQYMQSMWSPRGTV